MFYLYHTRVQIQIFSHLTTLQEKKKPWLISSLNIGRATHWWDALCWEKLLRATRRKVRKKTWEKKKRKSSSPGAEDIFLLFFGHLKLHSRHCNGVQLVYYKSKGWILICITCLSRNVVLNSTVKHTRFHLLFHLLQQTNRTSFLHIFCIEYLTFFALKAMIWEISLITINKRYNQLLPLSYKNEINVQ